MSLDRITLTMRQIDRLKVLQALAEGSLKTGIGAARMALSTRQTLRLLKRFEAIGPVALINGRIGRAGHNQLAPGLEARARGLIRDNYADFGPTLACEKLRESSSMT